MSDNLETFTLQDVERITNIRETTLRFYLKKFRKYFEPIHRGPFNSIVFTDKDINLFLKIRTLSKQHSLPMGEIEASLKNENLPAISIVRDEKNGMVVKETVDSLIHAQNDLKKTLCDNSVVLNELAMNQQLIQEKQLKVLKFLQDLDKLPKCLHTLEDKMEQQSGLTRELLEQNRTMYSKIENLEQENQKLRETVTGAGRGFWERVWVSFKSWFFEEA
ncbi:MAG: MerR family transcriptional regulator [Candidatus Wallbacteria bacterium]|nr:MerR family transcriptional regulator [Candidatus Wallbacteria bacterium]